MASHSKFNPVNEIAANFSWEAILVTEIEQKAQTEIKLILCKNTILAKQAEIFCGNSGNYYLSIAGVKSMLWQYANVISYGT